VTPDRIYSLFGSRVAALRHERGLKQAELAQRIGLSRSSVANIEAGRQKVLLHQISDIAQALDLSDVRSLMPAEILVSRGEAGVSDIATTGSRVNAAEKIAIGKIFAAFNEET